MRELGILLPMVPCEQRPNIVWISIRLLVALSDLDLSPRSKTFSVDNFPTHESPRQMQDLRGFKITQ